MVEVVLDSSVVVAVSAESNNILHQPEPNCTCKTDWQKFPTNYLT